MKSHVTSQTEFAGICRPVEGDCGVADARQGTHPASARPLQGASALASADRSAGVQHVARPSCSTLALPSDRLGIYPQIQSAWPLAETPPDMMLAKKHWHARLSLGFADDCGTTRLVERSHRGPLLVQKPLYPEGPQVCHAILIHPPGGVVGGDELMIGGKVGKHAHAFVTTPGAAKWYKANGRVARQDIRLDIEEGASLEWLPQETIFFNAADVQLDQSVTLAANAAYIGWEILCFGRTASGERFGTGRISQCTSIRRGGKLLWFEQGSIGADTDAMTSPLALRNASVCATLLAVGDGLTAPYLAQLREQMAAGAGKSGWTGATQMKQLCVARYLGDSSETAKRVMTAAWRLLRPALLGRNAVPPRIWNT